ncbi:hypothetical protein NQ317_014506 [Molorchus minor]|uniref:Tyr recombinase domain-containing protein n=1 Tax=Molorchus minor TaxID=1323400 RepID=A0ABQ9JJA6_9CUCU|nr:hypothetical protein NQ317_014506 [Molorchus minor]
MIQYTKQNYTNKESKTCNSTLHTERGSTLFQPSGKVVYRGAKHRGKLEREARMSSREVALISSISGACRCDELLKMKISDLDILENRIIIVIPVTKTYSSRTFVITKSEWINIIKQYCDLRNNIDSDRFFTNKIW